MRADLFQIDLSDISFIVDQPAIREGLRATVSAYRGVGAELLASDRFNLDRQKAREGFALAMLGRGRPTNDEQLALLWDAERKRYLSDLLVVRERIMEALAPGEAASNEPPPEPGAAALRAGLDLLNQPDVLEQAGAALCRLGYAGTDTAQLRLVVLVLVSRSLDRPINLLVTGPSSAGKSYLVGLATQLFPRDAVYTLSGMSERVLAYGSADLRHRYLVIGEATALHREGIGASLLRNLAWEGRIRYEVVERDETGKQITRVVERDGPTGFVTTSTGELERELATRVLTAHIDDTPAATRTVLDGIAQRATGAVDDDADLGPWNAAMWWLHEKGEHRVVIPFAPAIARFYPDKLVRARRDLTQLLNLIRASALLHQQQRARDDDGRIIAALADYETVYQVASVVFDSVTTGGLTKAVADVVEAVRARIAAGREWVTNAELAEALDLDVEAVKKRAQRAGSAGWLVNVQTRRFGPAQWQLGAPLPVNVTGLPHPDVIRATAPPDLPPTPTNDRDMDADDAGDEWDDPVDVFDEHDAAEHLVPLSRSAGFPHGEGQNGGASANVPPVPAVPHAPTTGLTAGQRDTAGKAALSRQFPHAAGQNGTSGTAGQGVQAHSGATRLGGSGTPQPNSSEIVANLEYESSGKHACPHCRRVTWWRLAGTNTAWHCITCDPPVDAALQAMEWRA